MKLLEKLSEKATPLVAFGVAAAFVPGWSGAATSPRWAIAAVSCYWVPWYALLFVAFTFWAVGVDLGFHWAIITGAFFWGQRADAVMLDRVILAFGLGCLVSVPLTVAQYFFGWNGIAQIAVPGGLFLNKNVLGETLALAIVALGITRFWLLAMPLIGALALTGARAAIIGVLAAVWVRLTWEWRVSVAALAGLVIIVVQPDMTSLLVRFEIWRDALTNLHWLGGGAYDLSSVTVREPNLHNEWLQRIYEFGIVGLVPLGLLGVGCVTAHRAAPVIVCWAVIACFSFPFAQPAAAWFGAFVLGAVLGRAPMQRRVLLRQRLA